MTNERIMKIALSQSACDYNCSPEDFLRDEHVITISVNNPKARKYLHLPYECALCSYGNNVVAQTNEELTETVREYLSKYIVAHSFETPNVHVLDEMLLPYHLKVCFTAVYYLPNLERLHEFPCPYEMRVLHAEDFKDLYLPEWSNALCENRKELDVLGVGAYDNGILVGLAGCSADCEDMYQIGIDVLPEYRRRGIAKALTSKLALEILKLDKVPFYCTAWCNIKSARNAFSCGFAPAWAELTVRDIDYVNEFNKSLKLEGEIVMKKLNLAIIGQGRSGKNIHGKYYRSESNLYYNVKYVVDADEFRRGVAEEIYPGCKTFDNYHKLFELDDIDLVVNSTYSEMHYPITKDLLLHGFNVLVEKPFGRTRYECEELIKIAKDKNLTLAVFQQTFLAPFYPFTYELIKSGKLGEIKQISIRYNNFARRWDWQTLQKKCAGGVYNTGPHPVGLALGFLDFDENSRVVYSKLGCALTSGDSDDFAKIIIDTPNKPLVDIEVSSIDAFSNYNVKILGTRGCFKCTPTAYNMTYIVDGENPEQPVHDTFIKNNAGEPIYCSEKLIKHEEEGKFTGTAFDVGTASLYEQLYYKITEGRPMTVTPEMAAQIIGVIETVHAQNPLPLKY